MDYSLENPIFGPQMPGPYPWDTPNRVHMWGWAPLPNAHSAARAAVPHAQHHGGLPGGISHRLSIQVVDEDGFLVGPPNSLRLPDYFNINLHLERQFRALHYLWAWRFGFNNLTNNGNPNVVNNVIGTPQFPDVRKRPGAGVQRATAASGPQVRCTWRLLRSANSIQP